MTGIEVTPGLRCSRSERVLRRIVAILGSGSVLITTLLLLPAMPHAASLQETLKAQVGALESTASTGGVPIAAAELIMSFYALRGHRPAWIGTPAGEQLIAEVANSVTHGLRPEDFHADALEMLREDAEGGDPKAVAEFEIVATEVAIRLLHHLYFGKVDPEQLDKDWNFGRPIVSENPASLLADHVDANGYSKLVDKVAPKHPQYLAMQDALDRYRKIAAAGGWPPIPADGVLKPGENDARVPLLRQRLNVTGELGLVAGAGTIYDVELEAAVKRFQMRHGLEADGVIGSKTFQALNATTEARVDQLRLSLERARWIIQGLGDEYVLVNIAGPETYFSRRGEIVWRTRSITGQQYRKTPVFRDEISYMEFNPTWTVPASIFRRDKLPKIRKDRGYLTRGGYIVRDGSGRTVDPASVNWGAKNPGVTLVQKPGPKNALGSVKFMFPNKYSVYLHDTDDPSLFDRAERNLSSGCVRLEDPYGFADLLMEGAADWSALRREEILASGKTTRVDLPRPIPVLLTYFTAWVNGAEVQFRRDIYERDAKLLETLNGAFKR